MDYGNREIVDNACLVELPSDLADLHILAYPYWLLKLKNVKDETLVEKVRLCGAVVWCGCVVRLCGAVGVGAMW